MKMKTRKEIEGSIRAANIADETKEILLEFLDYVNEETENDIKRIESTEELIEERISNIEDCLQDNDLKIDRLRL